MTEYLWKIYEKLNVTTLNFRNMGTACYFRRDKNVDLGTKKTILKKVGFSKRQEQLVNSGNN